MSLKKNLCALIAMMLGMLMLLCACGAAPARTLPSAGVPDSTPVPDGRLHVSTVDEFLAAIAPGAAVYLEDGTYDLTTAENYGKDGEYYRWNQVNADENTAWELVIDGADGFSVTAGLNDDKAPSASIVTVPRFANVICFEDCEDISLFGLVIGHTEAPGVCSGGVVYLDDVEDASIEYCELFGCGTVGLETVGCERVTLQNSVIRHCTVGAVNAQRSCAVLVKLCEIYDCGFYTLFDFGTSADCAVLNCTITENDCLFLENSENSRNINILGCTIKDNTFSGAAFSLDNYGKSLVVAGCEFVDNSIETWFGGIYEGEEYKPPVDLDGNELSEEDLEGMICQYIEWTPPTMNETESSDTEAEVTVSTVDELLAAIAPNTKITLEAGEYDLSSASDYGVYGGKYYSWIDAGDGPQLYISNVDKLTIVSAPDAEVKITAAPRYANVLLFDDCDELYIGGVTAGHKEAPGSCSGGVIKMNDCENAVIINCSLYGCGTIGVDADECEKLSIIDTEIYECSAGAVYMYECDDSVVVNCDIHDMAEGSYRFNIIQSENATVDGKPPVNG